MDNQYYSPFFDCFAAHLRRKADKQGVQPNQALALMALASRLEKLHRDYFASDVPNRFEGCLGRLIQRYRRSSNDVKREAVEDVLTFWRQSLAAVESLPPFDVARFYDKIPSEFEKLLKSRADSVQTDPVESILLRVFSIELTKLIRKSRNNQTVVLEFSEYLRERIDYYGRKGEDTKQDIAKITLDDLEKLERQCEGEIDKAWEKRQMDISGLLDLIAEAKSQPEEPEEINFSCGNREAFHNFDAELERKGKAVKQIPSLYPADVLPVIFKGFVAGGKADGQGSEEENKGQAEALEAFAMKEAGSMAGEVTQAQGETVDNKQKRGNPSEGGKALARKQNRAEIKNKVLQLAEKFINEDVEYKLKRTPLSEKISETLQNFPKLIENYNPKVSTISGYLDDYPGGLPDYLTLAGARKKQQH